MIETIQNFKTSSLNEAAVSLFEQLNIPLSVQNIRGSIDNFVKDFRIPNPRQIGYVTLLAAVDDKVFQDQDSEFEYEKTIDEKEKYYGIILLTVELKEAAPTRSYLAALARVLNRSFQTIPVVVLFRYGDCIAFANTERSGYKQEWRQGEKAGKVSLLRDISIDEPHTGHLKILQDLKIQRSGKKKVDSYEALYQYWQSVFDVNILNKRFYDELSNWYFWAIKHVQFPGEPTAVDAKKDDKKLNELIQEHRATNVIRLLTRLLFIWFIKEKGLVPEELFNLASLQEDILNHISPTHDIGLFEEDNKKSIYYKAILQNLFFATLNCPIESSSNDNRTRGFRNLNNQHFGVTYLMRYEKYFKSKDTFLSLVNSRVPFLNGGLFECLDKRGEKEKADERIWVDGFSDNLPKGQRLIVPDFLFFGVREKVDLSAEYGIKKKSAREAAVRGLFGVFNSYKFTITENTPLEEDVALDPELLGKVFENLLASYNPETKTTARKQTGSFYTPREIVNYMVDESLIAYLKNKLGPVEEETEDERGNSEASDESPDFDKDKYSAPVTEQKLRELVSFEGTNPFESDIKHTREIITALSTCAILDPACGSGAFPMGVLQKMVHVLQKLDPDNELWKEVQLEKAHEESKQAFEIEDKARRGQRLEEINEAFDQSINAPDFARKLYLIENCVYGVDIQPIAVQISKLRFFISLVVEQKPAFRYYASAKDGSEKGGPKDNFGIRPLPNLETKFVAANTLMDIKSNSNQFSLYESESIKKKEVELKNVRSKLFSARTTDTKLKYRKKDKELRTAIAEELKETGLPDDAASKLANWDPYDQNSSSPFFDPEWMFDISDGFDVVIGNPPYKILTKNNTNDWELNYYLKGFDSIKKSSSKNLYTLFIEKGVLLIKKYAILSYIVPEGLFTTRSYIGCVEVMEKYGSPTQIITFSDYVFDNAVTGNVIFLYSKKKGLTSKKLHFNKEYALIEKVENNRIEINEMRKDTVPLKKISTTFKGMVVKDRNEYISPEINRNVFLLGKNISKWRIDSYMYTDYNNLTIIGGTKKLSKHQVSPRILTRRTGDSLCCAYLKKPALTESTLYSTWSTNHKFSNLYLFGILNSKLMEHYNKVENITNQQGFPQILMSDLELLPIKEPRKNESGIVELFSIFLIHELNHTIESVLSAVIFNLYFPDHMKEQEIDVLNFVERDIQKVLQGREFDILDDAEKGRVIEQLHAIWTDSQNEVVQRMAQFKEKSPDIIKPILEGR